MPREESISTLTERLAALIGTVDQAMWTVDRMLEELGRCPTPAAGGPSYPRLNAPPAPASA